MSVLGKLGLDSSDIAICKVAFNLAVIEQNEVSKELFREEESLNELFLNLNLVDLSSAYSMGTLFFRGQVVSGKDVDVLVINDGNSLLLVMYLLENKYQSEINYFKESGFTKREVEIAGYVVKGSKNKTICSTLHISKDTLKSHLNKIYKKLPTHKIVSWR